MRIDSQLKQTIICTGAVGAFFGFLFAVASIAFYSEQGRAISLGYGPVHWTVYAGQAALAFSASVVGCILFFGLIPTALQHLFVYVAGLFIRRA